MSELHLKEIERHLRAANRSLTALTESQDGQQLRQAWEGFLASFARAMGRLISVGIDDHKTRPWAYQLKNASTGTDEGLVFLREARNHAEHALTPFADFADPAVNIGDGMISLGGSVQSAQFVGNYINGRPMGDFVISTQNGKVSTVKGSPNVSIVETPASVHLRPIISTEKKVTFPVPTSVGGSSLSTEQPEELAAKALSFISEKFRELIDIMRDK